MTDTIDDLCDDDAEAEAFLFEQIAAWINANPGGRVSLGYSSDSAEGAPLQLVLFDYFYDQRRVP